ESHERSQRLADAAALSLVDHRAQHMRELRVLNAGNDVLPAIRLEEGTLDALDLAGAEAAAAGAEEILRVGGGNRLNDPVDGTDELDQIGDRKIARSVIEPGVFALPLELIEHGVLRFFPPMEEKDVLVEIRQVGVGLDALAVMRLREQLDAASQ